MLTRTPESSRTPCRWWGGRDDVVAEAVFEEVEGAFGALPG